MSLGDYYESAREQWRVLLLLTFLLVSTVALIPGAGADGGTNLEYGLELSGGARVRAPLVGTTAENVDFTGMTTSEITEAERSVADELNVSEREVRARPETSEFEVYANVSHDSMAAALGEAGFDVRPEDVRGGVAEPTRMRTVSVLRTKISESPRFSGGSVQIVTVPGSSDHFLLVEIPNANRSEVIDLLRDRGLVEVVATYPAQTNNSTEYRNVTVFTQSDLAGVGAAEEDAQGPHVDVTLTEEATADFSRQMERLGFTGEGGTACNYRSTPESPGRCLITLRDGEYVYAAGMGPGLAADIRNGEFTGTFRMETTSIDEARALRVALDAGALPTDVAVEKGTSSFVTPTEAERSKFLSLVVGVLAAIAVAVVVYIRYGDAQVAAPMTLTALAEVYILLGFAAAIQLPLDLAHIAGFIAVIGTGVDDLVIIADEVLARGEVTTRRVFQSRFRKAFWVIGAAAATTIVAMSPLTVLSLGDLSGFAIVTIVGVLIGVLVTRPAYGDVLRTLMTRRRD